MKKIVFLFLSTPLLALAQVVVYYWRINIFLLMLMGSGNPVLTTFAQAMMDDGARVATCYAMNSNGHDTEVPDSFCEVPTR